jgi:enamine deaminase RidA (YjgF/YER057c/UK114 family)
MSSRNPVHAGGFIYLSGIAAPDNQGDVAAETRGTLGRARDALVSAGSSLDSIVSVLVFLKSASDFQAMNDAYRGFWKKDFPTRTTVVTELSTPGAAVEMSIVAVAGGGDRIVVHPQDWIASPSPYSYAVRSGDTVFLSGLVSRSGPVAREHRFIARLHS